MQKIYLSIITINYNNAEGLKKTLASVVAQTYNNIEHIIVDGGSKDGSIEVIKDYVVEVEQMNVSAKEGIRVIWSSEPDNGIYNAMNKGIKRAIGEYIQILNSGDCLASNDVVERMLDALRDNKYPDILYGNMVKMDSDGKVIGKSTYTEYSLRQFYSSTLNHDCAYIKKCLFDKYGYYDETLKIVSDWKWYLQAIGLGYVKPVYFDIDVTHFDASGISEKNLALRNKERRMVLESVMPPAILWDYDQHAFDAEQMNRLRRWHLYKMVWFVERCLRRLEVMLKKKNA